MAELGKVLQAIAYQQELQKLQQQVAAGKAAA
jgi:hypothetical protein